MFQTSEMTMGTAETNIGTVGLQDEVVLALSRSGREELRRPQAGLSLRQRKLLTLIDGKRSLSAIAAAEPSLHAERVARDAAQLLGRGFAELEQGWLQPITRPTTVMPTNPPATAPAAKPQARPVKPVETVTQARPSKVKPAGSWRPMVWLALSVAASVGAAAAYLVQPPTTDASPTSASSAEPRPISNAPAPPLLQEVAATPQRPAATPGQPAESASVAVSRPARPEQTTAAQHSRPPPSPVAAEALAAAPSQPVRTPAPNVAEADKATATPLATKTFEAAVAPQTPAVAVAVQASAAITEVPVPAAAVSTAEVASARATVAAAPAAVPADVPAWAREFAPIAPETDSVRSTAGALSPIERVPPIYPRDAARQGITRGSIRVRAVLAANGSVERVEFPSADAGSRVFERPARAALMTWVFPVGERGRVYETVLNFVAP
jgi:hypothetical protein